MSQGKSIVLTLYRWAGAWGPFKVNIPCGECSLTKDIIQDTLENELAGIEVKLDIRDWLSEWWKPLVKGGWHAPIVIVEGKVISQGAALNRGVLTQAVIEASAHNNPPIGNHIYGKNTCPHCTRAKEYLDNAGINYHYHNVIKSPKALYEMLARVKPIIGPKTPVTVPQIWFEGNYVGGADELSNLVHQAVTPNLDRGQCSMTPEHKRTNNE